MNRIILLVLSSIFFTNTFGQITTTTIQPDNSTGHDSYVVSGSFGATNYGSYNRTIVSYYKYGSGKGSILYLGRNFYKFNLLSIPTNAIIVSAELSLYCYSGQNTTLANTQLQQVESSWVESTITYNNQPNATVSTQIANNQSTLNTWHTFDVKSHVEGMVNDPSSNHGWKLKMNDEYNGGNAGTYSKYYYSSECLNSALRPKLVVQWVLPIEVESAEITHESSSGVNDGSINPNVINGDGVYSYKWYNGGSGALIATTESLTGVGAGWYGLEITDGLGNKEYMAFIVGINCESFSFDFQPNGNYVDDALITDRKFGSGPNAGLDNGNTNYGSHQTIQNYRGNYSAVVTWFNYSTLIRFKLWFDDELHFYEANMHMDSPGHYTTGNNATVLEEITSNWEEMEVTNNTRPSFNTGNKVDIPALSTMDPGYPGIDIDILSFIRFWQNNSNFGFHHDFKFSERFLNIHKGMTYHSSDYTDPSKRPKIEFNVLVSCEYARLDTKISRGYFLVKKNKQLRIQMMENYHDETVNLEYTIKDLNTDATFTEANLAITKSANTNWIEIDVSSGGLNLTSGHYYLLEVKNEKGDLSYLRFKKEL